MRDISQSLQGDAKECFKHLQHESIKTWEEFSDIFLGFLGKRKSLDQVLSEFYSMKKQEGETMSSFNRRFANFYYSMLKEIQPIVGAVKLHYADDFDNDFIIIERNKIIKSSCYVPI